MEQRRLAGRTHQQIDSMPEPDEGLREVVQRRCAVPTADQKTTGRSRGQRERATEGTDEVERLVRGDLREPGGADPVRADDEVDRADLGADSIWARAMESGRRSSVPGASTATSTKWPGCARRAISPAATVSTT
jgi:hypothetical protein